MIDPNDRKEDTHRARIADRFLMRSYLTMETTDTTDTRQNRAAKLARLRMVMAQMEASKIAITPVLQQVESRYWPNILHRRIGAEHGLLAGGVHGEAGRSRGREAFRRNRGWNRDSVTPDTKMGRQGDHPAPHCFTDPER